MDLKINLSLLCIDRIHPLNATVYDTSIVFYSIDDSTSSSVLEEIMKQHEQGCAVRKMCMVKYFLSFPTHCLIRIIIGSLLYTRSS